MNTVNSEPSSNAFLHPVVGGLIPRAARGLWRIKSEMARRLFSMRTLTLVGFLGLLSAAATLPAAPPANDSFALRTRVSTVPALVTGDFSLATAEAGEPNHTGGGKTLWWEVTAPANGFLRFQLTGLGVMAAYRGTTVTNLVWLANNRTNRRIPAFFPEWSVLVRMGDRIQVVIDGWVGVEPGQVEFYVSLDPAPGNDDFAGRQQVSGESVSLVDTNRTATREPGEPVLAANASGKTLWWSYEAPTSGSLEVRAAAGVIGAVFSGATLTGLRWLGQTEGWIALVPIRAGESYAIAADTTNGSWGPIGLDLRYLPPPPNDDFAKALRLTGTNGTDTSYVHGATREEGERPIGPGAPGHTIWWEWTAPATGLFWLHAAGIQVAVYTGESVKSLKEVVHGNETVVFPAKPGTKYRVALDAACCGSARLHYRFYLPPANDSILDRELLPGTAGMVSNQLAAARVEPGEPGIGPGASGRSVWYEWTARVSGRLWLQVDADFSMPLARVFQGANLRGLKAVPSKLRPDKQRPKNPWLGAYDVVAGWRYLIGVDCGDFSGAFVLSYDLTTLRVALPGAGVYAPGPAGFAALLGEIDPSVDGELVRVEYQLHDVAGGQWILGASATPPFSANLANVPGGFYDLVAVAAGLDGRLRHSPPVPMLIRPWNDRFVDRAVYRTFEWTVVGSTAAATREVGEPRWKRRPLKAPVWYAWIPPASGWAELEFDPPRPSRSLAIYRGNNLAELEPVDVVTAGAVVRWPVEAGVEYPIAVDRSVKERWDRLGAEGFQMSLRLK